MKVKWAIKDIYKADATACYEEITSIGERFTPEQVVEKARDESTELHKCFEWNDTVAAEKYRLEQARKLIRMFYVVPEKPKTQSVRTFSLTNEKHTYQPTVRFLVQHDEYDSLLKRALAELEAFKRKYKNLTELDQIFSEIDLLIEH